MKIRTRVNSPNDMRVIVPFTKPTHLLQTVVDSLRLQFIQPELYKVGDDDRYWQMLDRMWRRGETFYIVEQDVLVPAGGLHQLRDCPDPWCSLPTVCHGRLIATTFGAVKFGAALMTADPGFWADIPTTWFRLDANFANKMDYPHVRPHPHFPAALHINEKQWPDSISTDHPERKLGWKSMDLDGVDITFMSGADGAAEYAEGYAKGVA